MEPIEIHDIFSHQNTSGPYERTHNEILSILNKLANFQNTHENKNNIYNWHIDIVFNFTPLQIKHIQIIPKHVGSILCWHIENHIRI